MLLVIFHSPHEVGAHDSGQNDGDIAPIKSSSSKQTTQTECCFEAEYYSFYRIHKIWLAVVSRIRVSLYLGLHSWMHLNSKVSVHKDWSKFTQNINREIIRNITNWMNIMVLIVP